MGDIAPRPAKAGRPHALWPALRGGTTEPRCAGLGLAVTIGWRLSAAADRDMAFDFRATIL